METGKNPISRKKNIVIQELEDEILIYDLAKNKALCLNKTSKIIWLECDGTKSVAEISQKLRNKFNTTISEDLVWLALQQFRKNNLLEKSNDFVTPLDEMNRREIAKRIGFASMVALPFISAVLAPTAIQAQSTACGCGGVSGGLARSPGCGCVMNSDCCSNVCSGGVICAVSGGNAPGSAACCATVVCGPANALNNPPGCLCNGSANCSSGVCNGLSICTI